MKLMAIILAIFVVVGCGKKREANESPEPTMIDQLSTTYDAWIAQSIPMRGEHNGWITPSSCDGMLWTGLWASSPRVEGVDITASEYEQSPGRFGRRPPPHCWDETNGDVGSKTTWSRDMLKGLMIWSYRRGHRDVLERHAEYGKRKNWKMGEPLDDGRAVYTPSSIGELYSTIYAMGGEDNASRVWPGTYTSGLNDYQAHLQMLSIYIRGTIAEQLNSADAIPMPGAGLLDISNTMYDRIVEHSSREPLCPFYEYMRAVYDDGDLNHATELVMSPTWDCEYMRDGDDHRLAIQTFVGGLILDRVGK